MCYINVRFTYLLYELVSSVTSTTFGRYLLVPGTQLNKQQLTTAKVSVEQVGRLVPTWASWSGELTLGRNDWLPAARNAFGTWLDLYPKRAGLANASCLIVLYGSHQRQPTRTKR